MVRILVRHIGLFFRSEKSLRHSFWDFAKTVSFTRKWFCLSKKLLASMCVEDSEFALSFRFSRQGNAKILKIVEATKKAATGEVAARIT